MTALFARLLQLCGMIVLPIGLIYGLGYGDIRTEVKLLALGGFLFVLGWILGRERRA
jgi:high-affinity nickel permease